MRRNQLEPLLDQRGRRLLLLSKVRAAGERPAVAYWWLNRALYDPPPVLKWARARMRPGDQPRAARPKSKGAA
jgi:hypothetical protein